MRTIVSRPEPKPETSPVVFVFMVLSLRGALAAGGWAVMVALGIVGVSVSYPEALGLFALLRFLILPSSLTRKD